MNTTSVVRVGSGRGFVVEHGHDVVVVAFGDAPNDHAVRPTLFKRAVPRATKTNR